MSAHAARPKHRRSSLLGRALCRLGSHNDWLHSVKGPTYGLAFVVRCSRCWRLK